MQHLHCILASGIKLFQRKKKKEYIFSNDEWDLSYKGYNTYQNNMEDWEKFMSL